MAALLRAYAAREESWRPYIHYREDTYSRNLIWRCGDFELLILGWNENQESPIHDHAGQQCWMAVLEGELEEVHYQEGERTSDGAGPLRPGRAAAFPTGGVAYIHDDIALHLIRPKHGTRGASLHLYSNPIDVCRTFCPVDGRAGRCAGWLPLSARRFLRGHGPRHDSRSLGGVDARRPANAPASTGRLDDVQGRRYGVAPASVGQAAV